MTRFDQTGVTLTKHQNNAELDDYIIHWNTKRRQMRLGGHTLEEFWRASTVV